MTTDNTQDNTKAFNTLLRESVLGSLSNPDDSFKIQDGKIEINLGFNSLFCDLCDYSHKTRLTSFLIPDSTVSINIFIGENTNSVNVGFYTDTQSSLEIITQIKAAFKRFDEIYKNAVAEKENQITFAIDKDLLLSAIENEEWHVTDKELAIQSFLECLQVTEYDDLLNAVEFENRCAGEDCGVDFTYYDEP